MQYFIMCTLFIMHQALEMLFLNGWDGISSTMTLNKLYNVNSSFLVFSHSS